MFDPTVLLVDDLQRRVSAEYERSYGLMEPDVPKIAKWSVMLALETIATSDALYHDVLHTVNVTVVGMELLHCRQLRIGGVSPRDWLEVVLAMLCHDIGYVRGVCRKDGDGVYDTGTKAPPVSLARGATDASLKPWHVDRGMRFVRERFGANPMIDADEVARHIAATRFPVPTPPPALGPLSALVRSADLIGQLGDPHYLRKLPALYLEFSEIGAEKQMGFAGPDDLRDHYPDFYAQQVLPHLGVALDLLDFTTAGRQWVASLNDHLYQLTHRRGGVG